MPWPLDRDSLFTNSNGVARYELIATAIEDAITAGHLQVNERLPTVRQISTRLGVSGATVTAAYASLNRRGWIRGEVGRGTFIAERERPMLDETTKRAPRRSLRPMGSRLTMPATIPWRRRALSTSAGRLRAMYPAALDCTSGRPDPALLPLAVLSRAWKTVIATTNHADLQYAGPEPLDELVRELLPRLRADDVPARESDIIVGSSAQQLIVLALQVASALSDRSDLVIAVEEPGYPTAFDTFERAGYRLVGFEVDEHGAIPASLDAALAARASAVLFTPRAQNPVGASWSVGRVADIAAVLADHPDVLILEDDQFAGIAATRPGSLLADHRIGERVVYIRSFSKSIAPDLRIAVAVTRPRLHALLTEAKGFADGWTSRHIQRTLANVLADDELDVALDVACKAYAARRSAAAGGVSSHLPPGGSTWSGADGVNIWIHLPSHADASMVIERASALGVLVAPGEAFFIRPGRSDVVRLNAGAINAQEAARAGALLATAAMATDHQRTPVVSV